MNYTIIVNTCDGFEDCWAPFFTLMKKYWSSCNKKIILTTYSRNYRFSDLNIQCLESSKHHPKELQWSDNLILALDKYVDTDLVLLMLDDFFISNPVDEDTINKCAEIMLEENYSNITLTNHDTKRVYHKTNNSLLFEIDNKSPYRVTTSPALWKTSTLRKYLRKEENIWMFEALGTRRSYNIEDSFYKVNEIEINSGFKEVIPYFQGVDDTGIVKGKWQVGIDKLFKSAGIEVDYSKRGFYSRLPGFLNKYYLIKQLLKTPRILFRSLGGK